jgi:hypothetical protein
MNRIWIFGDSFASSSDSKSWSKMLGPNVINLASNGSSEYRIWKTYQQHKININPSDRVIFCHTSFSRVYLKNTETIWSRLLPSHPLCDLILADIHDKKEDKFISILKQIWDEIYFRDTYELMYKDLTSVPNSIHLNFFNSSCYYDIWTSNPGNINHMDNAGNCMVLENILEEL